MEALFYFVSLYFRVGLPIIALNLLINFLSSHSFTEAIYKETIRSGLPGTAARRNIYRSIVQVVVAWPIGLWTALRELLFS